MTAVECIAVNATSDSGCDCGGVGGSPDSAASV